MATNKNSDEPIKPDGVTIKLVWDEAANVPTVYANQLYITHAGNEFYLVFGEMTPVYRIDMANPPEQLEIKPVARIAVTPENMVRFADAIAENMASFKERLDELKE